MKRILLSASLAISAMATQAQSPKYQWAQSMGGTNNESGNAITVDSAGNVYTTGNFSGTTTFDASVPIVIASKGANDVFITKHDASGTLVWAKQIGGVSDDLVRGIAVDKDYVYITGNYNQTCDFDPAGGTTLNLTSSGLGDVFVGKYETSSGNLVWAKSMGGLSADLGFGIAVDKDGYVYTTGNFAGTGDYNPGTGTATLGAVGLSDIFISKLDKDGNYEWAHSIGGIGSDGGVSIALDQLGNPIIGGSFAGLVDFDPAAAISTLTSFGGSDIFVTKFNSMGLMQWAKQIGGTGSEYLEFLTTDNWGNIVYTARYDNNTDFDPSSGIFNITGSGKVAVSKLNNNGDFVWAKKIGSSGTAERSKAVAVDTFGSVYTVGEFDGTQDFDPSSGTANLISVGSTDVFVSKLDSAGNYSWAVSFGSTSAENGNGIAVSRDASVYTTGSYNGTCDFDPSAATTNLTAAGANDIFVHKIGQCIINKTTTLTGSTISANMAGASYQWVNCPSYATIAGATAQNYTPTNSGSYAVIITNGTGCVDTSDCVSAIGTGIAASAMASNISIYPNPANNVVVISNLSKGQSINIINTLGVSVFDNKASNSTMNIDVNAFASGMYFVQIVQDGQLIATRKLLISK
ncbi:MAG: SBBP repeat-containing protein [Chitinophagaceae bacterium]|nr:SBBP repeat-containing protein [Chitinophagaceae bacterium]